MNGPNEGKWWNVCTQRCACALLSFLLVEKLTACPKLEVKAQIREMTASPFIFFFKWPVAEKFFSNEIQNPLYFLVSYVS